jgi:hypothetical protein
MHSVTLATTMGPGIRVDTAKAADRDAPAASAAAPEPEPVTA